MDRPIHPLRLSGGFVAALVAVASLVRAETAPEALAPEAARSAMAAEDT